jgi:hypothetical protein
LTNTTATLQSVLTRTARRAKAGYLLRALCLGWLLGAGLASTLLALSWAMRWDISFWVPASAVAVLAAAGLVYGATRRVDQQQVAQWLDRQANTQERLTTAQWLSQRGLQQEMEQLQLQDAENCAQTLDIRRLARIPLPRTFWVALTMTALAVFLWFAPDLAWFQSPQTRQEKQALRSAGERAEQLAQEWRKQATGQDKEKMRRLAAQLESLSKQMKRARLSKREAMVKMSRLQREAEEQQRRLAEANSGKPLQRARDEFLNARAVQQQIQQAKLERELGARLQTAALKQKGEQNAPASVQNAAMNKTTTPFASEMAMQMALALSQQDAQKLAELLQQIAQQWNNLSPEERKKLEELLRELAKALKDTNLDAVSKELLEALKHLRVEDLERAKQCIGKACGLCQQAGACALDARQWAEIAAMLALLKSELGGLPVAQNSYEKRFGGGPGAPHTGPKMEKLEYRAQQDKDTARLNVKEGKPIHVPGVVTGIGEQPAFVTRGAPDAVSSGVPSYEVYLQYRRAAESALQRETVPPEYKQPVKRYFDSIKP